MDKESVKGHRERLRKKYQSVGVDSLHDYELIELLLTFAIPRKDVKPIAKLLLNNFKTIGGILDASPEELGMVKGLSINSATLFGLVKDLNAEYLACRLAKEDVIESPDDVRDFARVKLAGRSDEAFLVIFLNAANQVNNHEVINEGTVDQAVVYPRNIVKKAIAHNASGVIIVHNHPSGKCKPSDHDLKLTQTVREAVRTIDVRLVDHLIVGSSGCFSFVDEGLL